MAEYFKKKIIGKLSEKPIIVKKITPQPKIELEILIGEESPKEEIEITIEETFAEPETISEEPVTVPNETVITPEEPEVPLEEPTPKKSRKKKVQ